MNAGIGGKQLRGVLLAFHAYCSQHSHAPALLAGARLGRLLQYAGSELTNTLAFSVCEQLRLRLLTRDL